MINCKIILYSKNKESILQFIQLLQNSTDLLKKMGSNFQLFKTKKKRNKIAILKSPHVNKKAQEHFQIIIYKASINYFSWEDLKSFFLIKKIKDLMFSGLKIKIERIISFKEKLQLKKIINFQKSNPYKLCSFKQQQKLQNPIKYRQNKKLLLSTLQYFKNLDNYGYLMQKYNSLDSSVG